VREADREGQDQGPAVRHALHQGQAGRGAGGLRARRALILYGIASLVYALDRITKVLAEAKLRGRAPVELIPGVLELRYTTNPGGAFGLFGRLSWLFVAVSAIVVVVVVVASWRLPPAWAAVGLGLVLGGALGNLTDRLIRGSGLSGEVVDFIDLQVWPVFNVADTAIVVGAVILLVSGFRRDRAVSTAGR
jgi:signal peptidase II